MSVGHWIVVIADLLFAGLNLSGIVFDKKDREDPEFLATVIGVIVLMLFNVAAIAVR